MARDLRGRVELTWTNKHQRLVTLDDVPQGERYPYRWVPSADHRAAEIRLLTSAGHAGDPASTNLLIRGDALHALAALSTAGAAPVNLSGQVRLVYLDPPFNTGKTFETYEDNLERSIWLTMMRDRLRQVQKLLRADGSIWVHCDDSMGAHLRIVMDEVFGANAFVATVVWQKRTTRENRAAIGSGHDYLHVYSPIGKAAWAKVRNMLSSSGEGYSNPDNHPRGPWRSVPMSAQAGHATAAQFYDVTTPTGRTVGPPKGRAWTYTHERFEELVRGGRVYFPRRGDGRPRLRRFPDEDEGLAPMSWWPASEVGDSDEAKKEILALFPSEEAFDTPKPERLMRRIIEIATNPGEWVVDAFAGSGTTAAVAQKLGRPWVTVEASRDNVERYCLPRLLKVVEGSDRGGVTEAVAWDGSGGFAVFETAPSMFDEIDGIVVLANWAVGGALAEATAIQLGFTAERAGPFCGRKGRTRLAVIDGLVNTAAADLVIAEAEPGETVLILGTALEPAVAAHVAAKRPGSSAQTIPPVILNAYARPRRWAPTVAAAAIAPASHERPNAGGNLAAGEAASSASETAGVAEPWEITP